MIILNIPLTVNWRRLAELSPPWLSSDQPFNKRYVCVTPVVLDVLSPVKAGQTMSKHGDVTASRQSLSYVATFAFALTCLSPHISPAINRISPHANFMSWQLLPWPSSTVPCEECIFLNNSLSWKDSSIKRGGMMSSFYFLSDSTLNVSLLWVLWSKSIGSKQHWYFFFYTQKVLSYSSDFAWNRFMKNSKINLLGNFYEVITWFTVFIFWIAHNFHFMEILGITCICVCTNI